MSSSDKCYAHLERARQFMSKGKFAEAVAEYTKAINVLDMPYNHLMRAAAYGIWIKSPMQYFDQKVPIARNALPDLNYAIEVIKKAGIPEGFPFELEDFYAFRSTVFVYLGNPRSAIDDLSSAIRLKPNNASFYAQRGGIYLDQQNDPQKAADDFKKAIGLEPNAAGYLFLAWAYIDLENFEKAMMFVHIAAQNDMDVLDMERDHDPARERQWKFIRSQYIPYSQRH